MQKKSRVDDPMVAFLVKENWVKCIANLHVLYAVTEHVYKSQAFKEPVSLTWLSSHWNLSLFDEQ
jgi:hypothetical protein